MTKKIILDCDPGHDDAVAIMLAASSKEIDILGITCVGGNSGLNNTVNNALKVCTLIERTDIKVYSGADKPIHYELFTAEYVHGKTGLDKKGDPIIIDTNYKPQEKHAFPQRRRSLRWHHCQPHLWLWRTNMHRWENPLGRILKQNDSGTLRTTD